MPRSPLPSVIAAPLPSDPPAAATALALRMITVASAPARMQQIQDGELRSEDIARQFSDPVQKLSRLRDLGFVASWHRSFDRAEGDGALQLIVQASLYASVEGAAGAQRDALAQLSPVTSPERVVREIALSGPPMGDEDHLVEIDSFSRSGYRVQFYVLLVRMGRVNTAIQLVGLGASSDIDLLMSVAREQLTVLRTLAG